jgi:non-specific serine/threonine protein kinase
MSGFHLRDWQLEDVSKLQDVPARLIGTEMGLGKSYQAFALDEVNVTAPNGNTLYVGPLPTLDSLEYKARVQMGIDCPIVRIDPKDRNGTWKAFRAKQGAIFLMHWEALRLMPELQELHWDHIVADECHKLQGRKTQQTRALKKLKATYKTAMSGTPVTGSPDKMWSALNWLYPKQWSSYWRFYKEMVDYDIIMPQGYHKIKGLLPGAEDQLLAEMEPFYVRHLKRDQCCPNHPNGVAPWMPDAPVYTTYWVELSTKERRAYNDMKRDMIAWVGDHEDTPLVAGVVVAQMMRLQQFSGAFMDITPDGPRLTEPSAKLDAVMQIIEDNPNEPVVIWSMFKQMIYLLEARCKAKGISILLYTGDNRAERDQNVRSFANGGAQVFAGTISAGGVGVDGLQTASSTMVFLDRLWNPALNRQAEDRLDRDGQTKQVQIIDIMARNTVDLGRKQRLEMKWSWVRQLLGDTRWLQEQEVA